MKKALFIFILILFLTISCSIDFDKPEIVSLSVKDGSYIEDIAGFKSITINFNTPMNRYVTEAGIDIEGYQGGIHYKWNNEDKTCILYLEQELEKGNNYILKIDKSCESKNGTDIGNDKRIRFYTYLNDGIFKVIGTDPDDGYNGDFSDITQITINFSLPVGEPSIYDKIEISPETSYYYAFSDDRMEVRIIPVGPIRKNENYEITVKSGLLSESGKKLDEDYTFSFSTIYEGDDFKLLEAAMVEKGGNITGPHITINTDYLSETYGIDKDMELILLFNNDCYLNAAGEHLSIEPSLDYNLKKEDKSLRLSFPQLMASEEKYFLSIDKGFKDVNGSSLDKDYKFSWIIDGDRSKYLVPNSIHIKDPNGINDTLIYSDGISNQNEVMLLQSQLDHQEVTFEIKFSAPILVYRALEYISLNFMFGNSGAADGEMINYSWSDLNNTLTTTFSLTTLNSGQDAYYKFELKGGEEGILDINYNPLKEDISIYTVYDVQ